MAVKGTTTVTIGCCRKMVVVGCLRAGTGVGFGGFCCPGRKGRVRAVGGTCVLVGVLTAALGHTGCLGNGLSCCSCSQQTSPAWPCWSNSEALQAGIRKALQEGSHTGGSIFCNRLLFICLKCRQLTAHGESSHWINWPMLWTIQCGHFCLCTCLKEGHTTVFLLCFLSCKFHVVSVFFFFILLICRCFIPIKQEWK